MPIAATPRPRSSPPRATRPKPPAGHCASTSRWRDRDPAEAPPNAPPVVRFNAPRDGETVIDDAVQGEVRVANTELDDMVMLRADGTPTYMLSVVVDDHDMGVTHVIRGDDHLTNAFRQTRLFLALGWTPPAFAHIPLIHGADGAKLSKRHGALGVGEYRDDGLPARGDAQLPAAARLVARRRRDHPDRQGDRMVRPRAGRALRRAVRHGQADQPERRTSCAKPTMRGWWR